MPSVGTSRSRSPCGVVQLDGVAADARLQLVGRSGRDDAPAVEHRDAVGELVGLLEVLRGEEDRRAGVARASG